MNEIDTSLCPSVSDGVGVSYYLFMAGQWKYFPASGGPGCWSSLSKLGSGGLIRGSVNSSPKFLAKWKNLKWCIFANRNFVSLLLLEPLENRDFSTLRKIWGLQKSQGWIKKPKVLRKNPKSGKTDYFCCVSNRIWKGNYYYFYYYYKVEWKNPRSWEKTQRVVKLIISAVCQIEYKKEIIIIFIIITRLN